MKLTKKQEEIKAKILAGTHVLYAGIKKKKAISLLCSIKKERHFGIGTNNELYEEGYHFGLCKSGTLIILSKDEINGRPIINMSEWFEESEEVSPMPPIRSVYHDIALSIINPSNVLHRKNCIVKMGSDFTKEELKVCEKALNGIFEGSREYDENLLKDYNVFVIENDLEDYLPRARKEFVNQRYPNKALLKEKAEIEARLKEIEEQLGSKG